MYAGVAELADAPDLGSGGRPCRFKSCHPQENCDKRNMAKSRISLIFFIGGVRAEFLRGII